MFTNSFILKLALVVLASAGPVTYAQQKPQLPGDYPNKPIRIITAEAATSPDFTSRVLAQALTGPLGQPVIVENRPVRLAREAVWKAAPDGYTLLVDGGSLWINSLLEKTSFDPVRDFSPITLAASAPNVLVVHPSLPVKSVKELIALAKARPGQLNYGSAVSGSSSHLSAELFKSMAGVNIVRIEYRGGAGAVSATISGEVQLVFASVGAVAPFVKSGKMRALAITSAEPSELAPGLPTVAASGLPGFEVPSVAVVFAPAKTPAVVINRLNQEMVRVLNDAAVKERLLGIGLTAVGNSPEQLAATITSEIIRMDKVIKNAGIRVQ